MLHFHPNRRKKTASAPLAPPLKIPDGTPLSKNPIPRMPTDIMCVCVCAVNTTETFMHIACDIQVDDRFEFSQRC